MNSVYMNLMKLNFDWSEELENACDLSKREKEFIGFVIRWFESWSESKNLEQNREVARRFWKDVIARKLRASWQLEQWAMGMRWYLEKIERSEVPSSLIAA